MRKRRRVGVGVMCVRTTGVWPAVACALFVRSADCGDFEPFINEAVGRGVVYVLPNAPPAYGYLGYGCGFADFDRDGDDDILVLGNASKTAGLFENDGTGVFIDRSAASGIPPLVQVSGYACGDYDSDGDFDICFAQLAAGTMLVRNNGDWTFTDVTVASGIADTGANEGCAWGDYDGDGRLDLYIPNYEGIKPETAGEPDVLYHNNGDGTFTNVAPGLGLTGQGFAFQSMWSDYDLDGDVDLLIAHDRGMLGPMIGNKLFRNDGGTFTDVSVESSFNENMFGMGIGAGDFDNDMDMDYYVTNIGTAQQPNGGVNPLYVNQNDGTFVKSELLWGVGLEPDNPKTVTGSWWASIFFDFDNDGWQDLFVVNQLFFNRMLRNNAGNPPFIDVTTAVGLSGVTGIKRYDFAAATSDIDDDGDLDLLVNTMGGNVFLYINREGDNRNWLKLRIVGDGLNRDAIGGRVAVRTGAAWQMREVRTAGNGFLTQNSMVLHYGVDDASVVSELQAIWPVSGLSRTLTNHPVNHTWTVYPPPRLGDFDGDGVVDHSDFAALKDVFGAALVPGFEMMDLDGNAQHDLADAELFVERFEGPTEDCNANGQVDLIDILFDPTLDADGDAAIDDCALRSPDINRDGVIDGADLGLLLAAWEMTGPTDLNSDGTTDGADLGLLLAAWT